MSGNNPAFSDEAAHKQVDEAHAYHRPNFQETMDRMGALREEFRSLGHLIVDTCPASRERSVALTAIDKANMYAIAALARHEPEGEAPNTTSHPPTAMRELTLQEVWDAPDLTRDQKESTIKAKYMRNYRATPEQAQDFWNEVLAAGSPDELMK